MKNQWRVILVLFLVFLIALFAVINQRAVYISFGFGSVEVPLVLLILGAALLGALIVFIASSAAIWRYRKQLKSLKQELAEYQEQMNQASYEQAEQLELHKEEAMPVEDAQNSSDTPKSRSARHN